MQKRTFCTSDKSIMLAITIALLGVFTSCRNSSQPNKNGKVFISYEGERYVLYRDGKPYTIKGAAGFTNLKQLHDAGGNTIRIWDTLHLGKVLDEAHANNIAVIAGLPMPVSGILSYYNNDSAVAAQYSGFATIVNSYKSHPALLMWCLGNEVDFPYKPTFRNFYGAYNKLLKMIHREDPDHPVTTALVNFERRCIYNIRLKIPDLDLISINAFGSLHNLQKNLEQFSWFWDGPFLITEWGVKGPWESDLTAWKAPIEYNSTLKAAQYLQLYEHSMPVKDPRFLGAFVFLWGHKQEVTHTWFNMYAANGAASETVNVMHYIWTGKWPPHKAPELKEMLLDDKHAKDNIILHANSSYTAEVLVKEPVVNGLRMQWEILDEDWYVKNWYETSAKKPDAYDSLLLSFSRFSVKFRTPSREGPYRIFVTFFDHNGYFSSTNTPFYVVEQ